MNDNLIMALYPDLKIISEKENISDYDKGVLDTYKKVLCVVNYCTIEQTKEIFNLFGINY